jgi:NADPH:quinone reductase-like Zn-dependent oxidoreductase
MEQQRVDVLSKVGCNRKVRLCLDERSVAGLGCTVIAPYFELSGKRSFDVAQESLDEQGLFVDLSPSPAALIGNTIANPFRSKKHVFAMTAAQTADLEFIAGEIDAGRLRPATTRVFPLDHFADAFALAEGGGVVGKLSSG